MKKIILAISIVSFLVFLAGCNNKSSENHDNNNSSDTNTSEDRTRSSRVPTPERNLLHRARTPHSRLNAREPKPTKLYTKPEQSTKPQARAPTLRSPTTSRSTRHPQDSQRLRR